MKYFDKAFLDENMMGPCSAVLVDELTKDLPLKPGMRVLDLGCGMGVVGIVIKNCFMGFSVSGVDVNSRAVGLAQENAERNGVPVDFKQSDVLSAIPEDQLFDMVATNPPVRAGKATVFRFYEEAYSRMKGGAAIYVVLQRKQGAPSTEKKLTELFGNCETLGIEGGYRVMKAVKSL